MKTDKLLYELMNEIDDREAEMLDKNLIVSKAALKRQEKLIMDKIQMSKKKAVACGRRRMVILVMAAVMMFGTVAFAKDKDWDVEMAEMLGLSGVMESLEGGYIRIEKADRQDDITVTAVQSIGDRNSQWIQFDTDIPWNVGENGYYMFDESRFQFTKKNGAIIPGGSEFYSYNNNGKVSFMLYAVGVEKINRANVSVELGELYEYESLEAEGKKLSDACWNLSWTNYYASNTIEKYPFVSVDDLWIRKIEISPISIQVEAVAWPSDVSRELIVEQVRLKDGTTISCQNRTNGSSNNIFFDNHVVYEDWNSVEVDAIASVIINGTEITID